MLSTRILPVLLGALLCQAPTHASDWPQYRGINTDGIVSGTITPWAGAPKVVWKVPTPNGFSSFSVADGKAYTQFTRDVNGVAREMCVALDAATGKEVWAADVDLAKYDGGGDAGAPDNKAGDGSRSTPTFNDGKVYVLNQNLGLFCLDAKTGKTVWSKDVFKEHAGRKIGWRSAASVVIDEDLLFVVGGGPEQSILAFNKKDGKGVWKGFDEMMTHATPTIAEIHGVKQIIFFTQKGLVSLSPKDGKQLWRQGYQYNTSTAASPVVFEDIVFCSAGYGVGGGAYKIAKNGNEFTSTEIWRIRGNQQVANHWSTPVVKDGFLYGMFSFKEYGSGPMKCVDIKTGAVKWSQPGFGPGNVILVDDKVVALGDAGQLVIVEAKPDAYKELARAKVLAGKCWTTPAYADGKIYIRSTKEGACVDVSGK